MVSVETIGYNQDGKVVCIFRRKVMVPKDSYLAERGGAQPARPTPMPARNWASRDRLVSRGNESASKSSERRYLIVLSGGFWSLWASSPM